MNIFKRDDWILWRAYRRHNYDVKFRTEVEDDPGTCKVLNIILQRFHCRDFPDLMWLSRQYLGMGMKPRYQIVSVNFDMDDPNLVAIDD